MDSLEVNKVVASVLVAGIAFFLTGTIGTILVDEQVPAKPAIKIDVQASGATTAPPAPAELPPVAPLLAKADIPTGEKYAHTVCSACHTFNEGGKAGVGPNLYNVVGGPHAHMQGFDYSAALKGKTGPWTYDELNEWLHKPSEYAPGTHMTFAGISNDQTRADVIDYLHTLSPHPEPLPSPTAAPPAAPAGAKPAAAGGAAAGSATPAPAGDGSAPVAPTSAPVANGPAAPAGSAAPAAGSGTPAPSGGGSAPAGGSSAPAANGTAAGSAAPAVGSATPAPAAAGGGAGTAK